MIPVVIYFSVLLISIGAAAGSVLIGNYLRRSYPLSFLESYFYYIILVAVFGIYGIWGLVFIRLVLEQITISNQLVWLFSQVIPYLGFPFLIMAWYMFLKSCYEISDSNIPGYVSFAYFIFHLFFFISLGWTILKSGDESLEVTRIGLIYIYIILDVILTSWGLLILLIKKRYAVLNAAVIIFKYVLITFSLTLLKTGTVVAFYFYPESIPAFILIYFISMAFPLVFLYYNINAFMGSGALDVLTSTFDNLIARYGITKREREIIEEVCSGKSNQEIADTLFISLQTVKDHIHRIYLKMDIKNRVQLINIMQAGKNK